MAFLVLVVQEVSPNVLITSAKQERCMTHFLQKLGEFCQIQKISYPAFGNIYQKKIYLDDCESSCL